MPSPAPFRAAALLLGCAGALCLATPAVRAQDESAAPKPSRGVEEVSSVISEVDACNRAQKQRPEGAVVTNMTYWRSGKPGEGVITCMVTWSKATDARPTGRPILFGPSL